MIISMFRDDINDDILISIKISGSYLIDKTEHVSGFCRLALTRDQQIGIIKDSVLMAMGLREKADHEA